jgi:hypothetical protein
MIDFRSLLVLNELKRLGRARFRDLLFAVKNATTLSAKLKSLRSLGLVNAEGGYYRLTEKGELLLPNLNQVRKILKGFPKMDVRRVPAALARALKKYCELLYEKFGDELRAIILFGSVARGAWDENSDIDLLIVVDGWKGKSWGRIKELVKVRNEFRKTSEYRDVVEKGIFPIIQHYPISTSEAKVMHRVYLDASIEGVILYERDGFATKLLQSIRDELRKIGAVRVQLPTGGHYWVLAS